MVSLFIGERKQKSYALTVNTHNFSPEKAVPQYFLQSGSNCLLPQLSDAYNLQVKP